jgi:transcription elongation GreA/GreB family factor
MSVAFTKEESAETAAEVELPDREISPHPNLVTVKGLAALEAALATANDAYRVAQQIEDVNERRRRSAPSLRDIRYLTERVRTAQLMPDPASSDVIAFGHSATFLRGDGRKQTFRIVGEDEAEPKEGSISYVSPIARALLGKAEGDVATLGAEEIEILAVV